MKEILIMAIPLLMLTSCDKDNSSIMTPEPPQMDNSTTNPEPEISSNKVKVTIAGKSFTATLSTGTTVDAFKALLPLTLNMSDFNSNEKVCSLPRNLPTNTYSPGVINLGDIMLYGSGSIVIFYDTFPSPYSYSRIGKIDNTVGLRAVVGSGNVTVAIEKE